jgi:hypothetical protein
MGSAAVAAHVAPCPRPAPYLQPPRGGGGEEEQAAQLGARDCAPAQRWPAQAPRWQQHADRAHLLDPAADGAGADSLARATGQASLPSRAAPLLSGHAAAAPPQNAVSRLSSQDRPPGNRCCLQAGRRDAAGPRPDPHLQVGTQACAWAPSAAGRGWGAGHRAPMRPHLGLVSRHHTAAAARLLTHVRHRSCMVHPQARSAEQRALQVARRPAERTHFACRRRSAISGASTVTTALPGAAPGGPRGGRQGTPTHLHDLPVPRSEGSAARRGLQGEGAPPRAISRVATAAPAIGKLVFSRWC